MSKKPLLFSPLLLLPVIPPFLAGQGGLLFPLLSLCALVLTPLFTAPLLAGERSRGTDLLLLTGPFSDGELLARLFRRGAGPFLLLFSLPGGIAALLRLVGGDDGGGVILSCLTLAGEILVFTALGLGLSALCGRTVTAWILTYLILFPLNALPFLLPRWTDPLFNGYLPLGAAVGLPALTLWALYGARYILARQREDPMASHPGRRVLLSLCGITLLFLLPGGMDLTFSGQFRLNRVTARTIRSLEDPVHLRWYRTSNASLYGGGMENLEALVLSARIKGGFSLPYNLNRGEGGARLSDRDIAALGKERGWTVQTARGSSEPVYSAWEITYRGRTETLPFVSHPLVAEEQFLAALQRLSAGTRPVAGIITGRSDRPAEEFWKALTGALGEYYRTVDYTGRVEDILTENPDCLFVLGSRDLSDWECSRIFSYVDGGGSALVTLSSLELDPIRTDRILRTGVDGMARELAARDIYPGESLIMDRDRQLSLSPGTGEPPRPYPLWFATGRSGLFDYQALWSVPLYYTGSGELLWSVRSSGRSFLADSLTDLSPESVEGASSITRLSYTTALALREGEGLLAVVSGEESLSDLMALADPGLGNSAWIQSLAFYLSRNGDLLELRSKSGRRVY